MIHQIEPHQYINDYAPRDPKADDHMIYCVDNKIALWKETDEILQIPTLKEMKKTNEELETQYLFSIDKKAFYLIISDNFILPENAELCSGSIFREINPIHMAFAGITAMQLYRFYNTHRFCGKCGSKMMHSKWERAYECVTCGLTEYPKISPAVIVAIMDGDKLLMTKYAYGEYKKYALVAGFVEIGESFEETVKREILEEVGLKVKNIRYYKSQPWSFSDSIMIGFFADLDGDNTLTIQEEELEEAVWMSREEIPEAEHNISIGQEMIEAFRNHTYE